MANEAQTFWNNTLERNRDLVKLLRSPDPRIRSSDLADRRVGHDLLGERNLATQIWPRLTCQPVPLLRSRNVVVHFGRLGHIIGSS